MELSVCASRRCVCIRDDSRWSLDLVFPLFTFGVIPTAEYFSAPRAENLSEEGSLRLRISGPPNPAALSRRPTIRALVHVFVGCDAR